MSLTVLADLTGPYCIAMHEEEQKYCLTNLNLIGGKMQ
jgi:hypothetical protein